MKLIKCTCKHDYQDKKYGKGKRMANKCVGGRVESKYRCTVCGSEK